MSQQAAAVSCAGAESLASAIFAPTLATTLSPLGPHLTARIVIPICQGVNDLHFLFPGGWDISSIDSFNKSGEIDDFYIAIAVENNVSEFDLNTYS